MNNMLDDLYLDMLEYSNDEFEIYKMEQEIIVMNKYIENLQFVDNNSWRLDDSKLMTEGYFMESSDPESKIMYLEEKVRKKQGNIFQRIWQGIANMFKKFVRWITGAKEKQQSALASIGDVVTEHPALSAAAIIAAGGGIYAIDADRRQKVIDIFNKIAGSKSKGDATSGDATSNKATSSDATSGDATSNKATSGDATSGDATSGDATSNKATSSDATSSEIKAAEEEVIKILGTNFINEMNAMFIKGGNDNYTIKAGNKSTAFNIHIDKDEFDKRVQKISVNAIKASILSNQNCFGQSQSTKGKKERLDLYDIDHYMTLYTGFGGLCIEAMKDFNGAINNNVTPSKNANGKTATTFTNPKLFGAKDDKTGATTLQFDKKKHNTDITNMKKIVDDFERNVIAKLNNLLTSTKPKGIITSMMVSKSDALDKNYNDRLAEMNNIGTNVIKLYDIPLKQAGSATYNNVTGSLVSILELMNFICNTAVQRSYEFSKSINVCISNIKKINERHANAPVNKPNIATSRIFHNTMQN